MVEADTDECGVIVSVSGLLMFFRVKSQVEHAHEITGLVTLVVSAHISRALMLRNFAAMNISRRSFNSMYSEFI